MGPEHKLIDAPADFRNLSPFYGAVDNFDPQTGIRGWVVAHDNFAEPVLVEAFYRGERIGSASASSHRSDIAKLLECDLKCGFNFKWSDFDAKAVSRLAECGDGRIHFLVGKRQFRLTCYNGEVTIGQIAQRIPRSPCITYRHARRECLYDAIKSQKRVAVIASFINNRFLLTYHRSLINRLAGAGYVVILVHSEGRFPLKEEADTVENLSCLICRDNKGYDFGSWALGIRMLSDYWHLLDELLLVNDSNFGNIDLLFPLLNRSKGQFLCLTDSYETSYHAQSYFMLFRKAALHEGAVLQFFEEYAFPSTKEEVIRHGELGLTRDMLACGIELTPLCPYEQVAGRWLDDVPKTIDRVIGIYRSLQIRGQPLESRLEAFGNVVERVVSNKPLNPSHFFWRTLIRRFNHPFIKRELIMKNPANVPDLILAFVTSDTAAMLDKKEVLQYAQIEGGSPLMHVDWHSEVMLEAEGARSEQAQVIVA